MHYGTLRAGLRAVRICLVTGRSSATA